MEEVQAQLMLIKVDVIAEGAAPINTPLLAPAPVRKGRQDDPCADFDVKLFPQVLRDYIVSIAATTGAHPIMITSSVMSTLSAFARSHIFLQDYFQDLYPNLWFLNVTQSGQFKSTALMKGAELVHEKAEQIARITKRYDRDIKIASTEEEKATLRLKRLEASIGNVLLPNKVKTEALLEHMAYGHGGVILASEFGGWLQSMEQKHNSTLKSLLTEIFDVPATYHYKTKKQGGNNILRPYLTICAVSTMPWIRNHVTSDDVSSGFFARFLIFMPPHQEGIPDALPSVISSEESILCALHKQRIKAVLADLFV